MGMLDGRRRAASLHEHVVDWFGGELSQVSALQPWRYRNVTVPIGTELAQPMSRPNLRTTTSNFF
jgi:hypothetical protein